MSEFTPGPWRVYNGWVHPTFDKHASPHETNGDTAICEPLGPDKNANVRLIASAPDMYNALHDALQALEDVHGMYDESDAHFVNYDNLIKRVKGVLAQAEGEHA